MLKKVVSDWLAEHGVFHWDYFAGDNGIVALLENDTRVFIECVYDHSVVALDRLNYIAQLAKRGAIAFVAESIEDVERHLAGKI